MSSDAGAAPSARMIDLFAGPGGLDVAAHWLGISVTGVEWDVDAVATRDAAGLVTRSADVRDLGPELFEGATVLAGGPPCQTFSVAGSGAGRGALDDVLRFVERMGDGDPTVGVDLKKLADERTGLVLEPLRWALAAMDDHRRPYEVIVLEQVPAVLPVWRRMGAVLASRGYEFVADILRAEEFGVPQTRRRAILIAHLHRRPHLPRPTHRPFRRETGSARGDLAPWLPMGPVLAPGAEFVVVSNYGTGGDPKARGRRRHDEPAYTVTGKVSRNKMVTMGGDYIRNLDHRDAGRLQTFPHDYPWAGRDVAQQIGNAIPPRLAVHVLAAALFDHAPDENALNTVVAGDWGEYREGYRAALLGESALSA
ncbi:DNA cytosine methyltransferase [Nocardia bovistercoris]|uniref:DNA (cytosine-5-)-methyltransferase n=1 Tax=Nocardia bovistercoris TaxID=2785916 RepID=A0A931IK67_9NOCA|nr:DNA cytosine methyltransferase [Nocardia bovistercoris]MBH0781831.1 DNA cytosine methyltransferase [Nocardia bovistercoris]